MLPVNESVSFASNAAQVFGATTVALNAAMQAHFYVTDADGDDGDGSAGVREPRRPLPAAPAGTMKAELAYSGSAA
jgi:hypothetical protein